MNDTTAPATGDVAQPVADVTIEGILNQNTQQPTNESKPPEGETEHEEAGKPEDETPFPKKAVNALSRRDKKIGKLGAENEFLKQELAKYQQQKPNEQAKTTDDGAPKESDYSNVLDYLKAHAKWEAKQELTSYQKSQQETQKNSQFQKWEGERKAYHDEKGAEFFKANPDALEIIEENADTIAEFPAHVKLALLEADNAAQVLVSLAKTGKLEALASMSPARAAMEIGRAEQSAPLPKPQTKAPAPLPASRGSVPASKPLEKLTALEAHKLLSQKE